MDPLFAPVLSATCVYELALVYSHSQHQPGLCIHLIYSVGEGVPCACTLTLSPTQTAQLLVILAQAWSSYQATSGYRLQITVSRAAKMWLPAFVCLSAVGVNALNIRCSVTAVQ